MKKVQFKIRSYGILFVLLGLISVITLTTLYYKPDDSSLLPGNIMVLTMINVNVILCMIFLLLLCRNIIKLYFERSSKAFGASFRTKLISSFVGFALVPTTLLFIGSSGVVTGVIENWLSIQMEAPLRSSLEIAQIYYEDKKNLLLLTGDMLASQVVWGEDQGKLSPFIDTKALKTGEVSSISNAYIVEKTGEIKFNFKKNNRMFSANEDAMIKEGLRGNNYTLVESRVDGDMVSGVVPLLYQGDIWGVVMTEYLIDASLVKKMEGITSAFEDFYQLKSFKNPIKESYMLSIFIITLVILFSATWFGFYLGKGITVPILTLADATQEVAKGNYDFKIDIKATSEIGLLVNSFNKMTSDLKKGKQQLEESDQFLKESYLELDLRRGYIETVLDNVATGVISLGKTGQVSTFNRSAEKILAIESESLIGLHFKKALKDPHLLSLVNAIEEKTGSGDKLFSDVKITISKARKTLRMNVASLYGKDSQYMGSVIVFDDLSELVKAQKVAAWEGVARRIAHEIKNPLTPIQLSTERLRKKFFNKDADFDEIFDKSTQVVINEVHTMKTLVNEFSEFSRLPSKKPVSMNLNQLLQDITSQYKNLNPQMLIETDFDPMLPELMADSEQLKRVCVNLLENAIEAIKSLKAKEGLQISVSTSLKKQESIVVLIFADEGPGMKESDLDKLFIPYFSKKKTGTGLGLAIVEKIISDHNGTIRGVNNPDKGASFIIELPV